ncbi:hypothetical protein AOQ71_31270 [Bradyrhizobium manausense]|uniref:Uncharacterized protein n=1 Tax=Bradyrhizobium manausense TaxID=989370 RepID=A0A0R3D729_9BRAD|nr:hypothetical protein AOQ71_31270 [Bradyrhizobium manausense]
MAEGGIRTHLVGTAVFKFGRRSVALCWHVQLVRISSRFGRATVQSVHRVSPNLGPRRTSITVLLGILGTVVAALLRANIRVWTALALGLFVIGLSAALIACAQPCGSGRDLAIGHALLVGDAVDDDGRPAVFLTIKRSWPGAVLVR